MDAWAGLDPMMAETELEKGSVLFHRNADANTYGVLNVREVFAKEHPEIVVRVLRQYERAQQMVDRESGGVAEHARQGGAPFGRAAGDHRGVGVGGGHFGGL
ncbi:MAG: hypothetical protein HC915_17775 [Anaerolineae bacterium]|nr:hypothetical protein [Anaerolineae bacterium]